MQQTWQSDEAQNQFSHVIADVMQEETQLITLHGVAVAVVLSTAEYRKLLAPRKKLSQFFRDSPLASVDLDLGRTADA